MSKVKELIKKYCPDGCLYYPLKEKKLFRFYHGKGNKIPTDTGGIYDVYGANGVVSHIDEYNCEDVSIIGHIGAVGVVNRCKTKCFVTYNGTIAEVVNNSIVDSQYLYYILTSLNLPTYQKGSQPFLSVSDYEDIEIPIPPLYIQEEIVRILDKYTEQELELERELEQELELRKKQYEYYRDKMLALEDYDGEVEEVSLGTVARVSRGGNFQKKDFVSDGKPCIHYGQIYTRYGLSTDTSLTSVNEEVWNKSKKAKKGNIVMAVTSENYDDVCKCVVWEGDEDAAISGHTAIIDHDIDAHYLAHYFNTSHFYKQKLKIAHGTKVIEVTPAALNDIIIKIPKDIDEQTRIANLLDGFEKLVADISEGLPAEIKMRYQQYEYYRDKLLSFKRKETVSDRTA